MATLLDFYIAYKGDGRLLDRITGACIKKAGVIRTEDGGTTNHTNRLIWAAQVETNAVDKARQMLPRVLANGTIASELEAAGDGLIETVVGNLIDTFSTGE